MSGKTADALLGQAFDETPVCGSLEYGGTLPAVATLGFDVVAENTVNLDEYFNNRTWERLRAFDAGEERKKKEPDE